MTGVSVSDETRPQTFHHCNAPGTTAARPPIEIFMPGGVVSATATWQQTKQTTT